MAEAPFHNRGWEENIRSCVYVGVSCINIYEMDGLYRLRLERHWSRSGDFKPNKSLWWSSAHCNPSTWELSKHDTKQTHTGTWTTQTWLINPKYPTKGGAFKASAHTMSRLKYRRSVSILVPRTLLPGGRHIQCFRYPGVRSLPFNCSIKSLSLGYGSSCSTITMEKSGKLHASRKTGRTCHQIAGIVLILYIRCN